MIVGTRSDKQKKDFEALLKKTVSLMEQVAMERPKYILSLKGQKLEPFVFEQMESAAKGGPFEGHIQLVSGLKFPDIVVQKYFGLEVKSSSQKHWRTLGNSIMETTRVEDVERIYLLFGQLYQSPSFKVRPYEDCLSEIVVTHSPRYLVDMNTPKGQSFFDKIKIPYDELRSLEQPIKPVIQYYKQFLKAGEELWWMGQEEEPQAQSMIIRLWSNLSLEEKKIIRLQAFGLFPELFQSKSANKYNRLSIWLIREQNISCHSLRDVFSAGGKMQFFLEEQFLFYLPRVVAKLLLLQKEFQAVLLASPLDLLSYHWGQEVVNEKDILNIWWDLFEKNYPEKAQLPHLKNYFFSQKTNYKLL